MLIPAARPNTSARQVSQTASLPAPTGGWNARDPLANMDAGDAIQLDNYIPGTQSVNLRTGSRGYAYYVGQLTAFTRSTTASYFDSTGTLQTASTNTPRYTYYSALLSSYSVPQLIIEAGHTNYCLWNRDLTNAAWTKTNVTAVHTAVGIDGSPNSATQITASAAGGTVTQALTAPSGCYLQLYIKRVTGSGAISYTLDGAAWTQLPAVNNTSTWQAIGNLTTGGVNPTIGLKIASNGDSFIVDCVGMMDLATAFPVATTTITVTVGADTPTYSSGSSATAVGQPIETLISYSSGTTSKFLASAAGSVYDITSGGAAGLPLATGFSSNRWQDVFMGGYQLLFNGVDTPQKYDGTSVTANTITGSGLTSSNLIYPNVLGQRVFMVEKNTLNVWYMGIQSISGGATKLDFSNYCKLGGTMIAMGTWSRDGGSGITDLAVFVTSMGEVLVYEGADPSSSTTWALVGVFRIGAPIGQRPLLKVGSDLIVICEDGFVPLSKVLPIDRYGAEVLAISDKIRNATAAATTAYRGNFGWQICLYPQANWLVFNVPVSENQTQYQYVLNTLNNSWCQFIGWNANCFGLYTKSLYFGGPNGFVCKADTGSGDDNCSYTANAFNSIQGDIKPSFQYFSGRSQLKQFKMVRPVITSNSVPAFALAVCTDFGDSSPAATTTPALTGAVWDQSPWDTTPWSSSAVARANYLSVTGIGYSATVHLRTITSGITISLMSIDWVYESGGVL